MIAAGRPQAALSWLTNLPPFTRTNLPVPMVEADCYMLLKQWPTLLTNLAAQSWLDLDCLRLITRVRAFKELGSLASAKTEWIEALRKANGNLQLLSQMLRTAVAWNWRAEQEEILWVIVNRYPNERGAVPALSERLFADGNTRGLQTLFSLAIQRDPTNLPIMNNLASTAMLTESWDKKPHDLAREAYAKCTTNAAITSTYAYSRLLQREPAEALKIIERLSPRELEDPSIALYYGLILKANGNGARAAKYFDLATKASLLPEEQKLLERARR